MKTIESFSYFKSGVTNVIPLMNVSLPAIYGLIKSTRLKEITEKIRLGKALKTRDLPSVCFSGIFKSRGIEGLLDYSGLICLDIDDFDFVPSLKERISKDVFLNPVLIFISPRGRGLKIVIRIQDSVPEKHGLYFDLLAFYLKAVYEIEIDASGSDVSRLCFICHDPEPYFFEDGFVTQEALLQLQPKMEEMNKKQEKMNETLPASASSIFVDALKNRRKSCRDAIHRVSGLAGDAINRVSTGPGTPSDRLNHLPAVHDLAVDTLKHHGWKQKEKSELWVRAGKKIREGHSAKYSFYPPEGIHVLYNFSSNAQPFQQNKGYSDVQIICELDYGGDFKKCVSELSRRYSNT